MVSLLDLQLLDFMGFLFCLKNLRFLDSLNKLSFAFHSASLSAVENNTLGFRGLATSKTQKLKIKQLTPKSCFTYTIKMVKENTAQGMLENVVKDRFPDLTSHSIVNCNCRLLVGSATRSQLN